MVQAAGESATHLLGRAVLVPRALPCGECEACRRGRIAVCPTRHQRPLRPTARETVPARFLLPLEPPFVATAPSADDRWRYAALADALLSPYAGLVRIGQSPGGPCTVLGSGPRAAAAVMVVRALGCQAVVIGGSAAARERLCAPPYSALAAFDAAALDGESARPVLRELASEHGMLPHGLTHIETTGSDAGRARALGLLEAGGTAILLDRSQPLDGAPAPGLAGHLAVDPSIAGMTLLERVSSEQCLILGAGPGHPDLLPELLALVERAGVDLLALTRAIAPADVDAEMEARRAGRSDELTLPIVRIDGEPGHAAPA